MDYNSEKGKNIVAESLLMVEMCVMDMAESGFTDGEIATALAHHMLERIERFLPDRRLRKIWLESVINC